MQGSRAGLAGVVAGGGSCGRKEPEGGSVTREQGWMSFSRRRPPNLGRCRPQALTMCPLPPPPRTRRHPLARFAFIRSCKPCPNAISTLVPAVPSGAYEDRTRATRKRGRSRSRERHADARRINSRMMHLRPSNLRPIPLAFACPWAHEPRTPERHGYPRSQLRRIHYYHRP